MKNDFHNSMFSFVIPVLNEVESIEILIKKIEDVMNSKLSESRYEVIVVDDGSTDGTLDVLRKLYDEKRIKFIELKRNYGKSIALTQGFRATNGDYIVTIDGDLQDDPYEIPKMLEVLVEGYDLVSGWKKNRKDPLEKRLPSKVFNWFASKAMGLKLHDYNCGFKIYKKWVTEDIDLTGNHYRFLPGIASNRGAKVAEVPVNHLERKYGKSKYGFTRYFHGALDLLTMVFILRFFAKPLYFFSFIGLPFLMLGLSVLSYLVISHCIFLFTGDSSLELINRPLLNLSAFSAAFGLVIVLNGLLAEFVLMKSKNNSNVFYNDNL